MVRELLSRYFSKNDLHHAAVFRELFSTGTFSTRVRGNSLAGVREGLTTAKNALKSAGHSNFPAGLDAAMKDIRLIERSLVIVDDLENMRSLLEVKGIDADFDELISEGKRAAEEAIERKMGEAVEPMIPILEGRLEGRMSREALVREALTLGLTVGPEPGSRSNLNPAGVLLMSTVLNRFGLGCDRDELESLIEAVRRELNLEEFERTMSSSRKGILSKDFSNLGGHEFEEYLAELFRYLGFSVFRPPESRDKGADLIISKEGVKTIVQAKRYEGKVSNRAIQEAVAARGHYQAKNAMVVTNSSFTKDAIQLALTNNVDLWDGEKLAEVVKGAESSSRASHRTKVTAELVEGRWIYPITAQCPLCTRRFECEVDIRESKTELTCPHCQSSMTITVQRPPD